MGDLAGILNCSGLEETKEVKYIEHFESTILRMVLKCIVSRLLAFAGGVIFVFTFLKC